jgi:hypothetical protein
MSLIWEVGWGLYNVSDWTQDWQRFKQLEAERREEAELERLALAKKLSLSCQTEREEERDRQLQLELDALDDDDFMKDYMAKRMQEMMNITRSNKL